MLFFKKHFLPLIKSGRKRQTIRFWRHARVRPGQRAFVPGLGYVRVTRVEELASLRVLTPSDAKADGFGTLRELLAAIRLIYGSRGGRKMFRVRFRWPAKNRPGEASRRTRKLAVASDVAARREELRAFVLSCEPG